MKNILNVFSNLNVRFMHKSLACVLLACIALGSIEFVPVKYDFSFMKTINISADTAINHFFSLATVTMNIISSLFAQAENAENTNESQSKNKQEKTSKEASSFSVLPADVSFSSLLNRSVGKVKNVSAAVTDKICAYPVLFEDLSKVCKEFMSLNIMLFILMMFLIKKNTSSDNYNNIKLKNTCISLA